LRAHAFRCLTNGLIWEAFTKHCPALFLVDA
jgi:hypothetical protein